jgi:hypothetical protein
VAVSAGAIDVVGVRELPDSDAAQIFDRQAQALTGQSGVEFISRWCAGEYVETDDENVMHMIMLLPLVMSLPPTSPPHRNGTLGPAQRVGSLVDRILNRLQREVKLRWPERTPTKR